MRPSLSSYVDGEAKTLNMDSIAKDGTVFSRAYCQIPWCAPSRNSFLTGRYPNDTKAYNFIDSFREKNVGENWVTLPQYFKMSNFYTSSVGKIFHPNLPPNFDYPKSWSDLPFFPVKPQCPRNTMSCSFTNSSSNDTSNKNDNVDTNSKKNLDVDYETYKEAKKRINTFLSTPLKNFFLAVGFQSPRLPWSYPAAIANEYYPDPNKIPLAKNLNSSKSKLEWFRPTEIDMYSNIRNVTHKSYVNKGMQRTLRRDYFSAITHVDNMVGLLLQHIKDCQLLESTNIILMADHGQNLGENNMWSMMNLLETSLQVPLLIKPAKTRVKSFKRVNPEYNYPVELVDIFPTAVSLAGLPQVPFYVPGEDLTKVIYEKDARYNNKSLIKKYAFSEISRCKNCTLAYAKTGSANECIWDDSVDGKDYTVPCATTPRSLIDYMGFSVYTANYYRYSIFCKWNGEKLRAFAAGCKYPELYNLRNNSNKRFVPENGEIINLAYQSKYAKLVKELFEVLKIHFQFL
eukprot:g2911.t1